MEGGSERSSWRLCGLGAVHRHGLALLRRTCSIERQNWLGLVGYLASAPLIVVVAQVNANVLASCRLLSLPRRLANRNQVIVYIHRLFLSVHGESLALTSTLVLVREQDAVTCLLLADDAGALAGTATGTGDLYAPVHGLALRCLVGLLSGLGMYLLSIGQGKG